MSRWVVAALIGIVGCFLLAGMGAAQENPPLPQQMGAINDYAASLGRQTREGLQSRIDRLASEADVDLAVLISLIDPFGDPARYAEAIWEAWGLGPERSVLLVVVREAESRWAFRARGSSDVGDQLSPLRLGETRAAIDAALADRDVADAVRIGVDALVERWAPVTASPSSEDATSAHETSGDATSNGASNAEAPTSAASTASPWWRPLWAWIAGGVALLAGVLAVAIWALLTWFCPRCGARLRKRTGTSPAWERLGRGSGSGSVYYCPRCRYVRRASRPRRHSRRRPQRPKRRDRRNARWR